MVKFLDLHKQYLSIKGEIDAAIKSVISDSAFVGGKYVNFFEEQFRNYIAANYCIGVANGTDALEIAIKSLELPANTEIIVPANSFVATAEAVINAGYKIKFCDNNNYYNIDYRDFEENITENTSAVIFVHLYGQSVDFDNLLPIAKKHNLKIIEDCAQAHGTKYKNKKVGTFGDIAAFSFYPGKNLGAYGDAGAIITNDYQLANKCRLLANHGSPKKHEHTIVGRNSRLDGINAAILNAKLYHLDKWNAIRNVAASYYNEYLKDVGDLILPEILEDTYSVFHLYVIRTKYRDELADFLNKNEIETGIHYPIAIPKQKAFSFVNQDTTYMRACNWDKELLSLPMGEHLTSADTEKVVSAIRKFFS